MAVKYTWKIESEDIYEDFGVEADSMTELKLAREEIKVFVNALTPRTEEKEEEGFCKKHNAEMKKNKNGKWYHTQGRYPDLEFCNGFGWPDET